MYSGVTNAEPALYLSAHSLTISKISDLKVVAAGSCPPSMILRMTVPAKSCFWSRWPQMP